MKIKLLNAGGYGGMKKCIGKTFKALDEEFIVSILGTDLIKAGGTSFEPNYDYSFLPEAYEVIEK